MHLATDHAGGSKLSRDPGGRRGYAKGLANDIVSCHLLEDEEKGDKGEVDQSKESREVLFSLNTNSRDDDET